MCGRFSTGGFRAEEVVAAFDLQESLPFQQNYNVAPTQPVPAIRERDHKRVLETLRWGLIPHWAKDKSIGSRMINARAESLSEKPAFRKPFKSQRCLILASGFYEWQAAGNAKQPFYIYRADDKPIAFAGLWEHWVDHSTGEVIESCAIITRQASLLLAEIHDRMPVILDYAKAKEWIKPEVEDTKRLREILANPGAVKLDTHPVSDYVNNVRNGGERCIGRVGRSGD